MSPLDPSRPLGGLLWAKLVGADFYNSLAAHFSGPTLEGDHFTSLANKFHGDHQHDSGPADGRSWLGLVRASKWGPEQADEGLVSSGRPAGRPSA